MIPSSLLWLLLLVSMFGGTSTTGERTPALPREYPLAEVAELNPDGWGTASSEGGRTYRAAIGGKSAWLRVPAWWGDAIRPPRGTHYVIEVTYKDLVDKPVIAEIFGAIEPNLGRTEMHRFGGLNDGQWKVAAVPCGWDTLIRPKGSSSAEIAFRAVGDLPVAGIRVRKAKVPEDQRRFEAETREWVSLLQAGRFRDVMGREPGGVPSLPAESGDWAFVPYVRPYYERIVPSSLPRFGEALSPIRVRLARNEFEPVAFAVYALKDVVRLTYSVSDFRDAAGKRLSCEVVPYTAEFALEQKRAAGSAAPTLDWAPQRLWPAFETSIRAGRSAWFYFTIHTLGTSSIPGKYSGKVTISDGETPRELPVEVEVLPLTLMTMEEAGLRMGGCAKGLPPASDLAEMRLHNHNMINLWFSGVRPEARRAGDGLALEYYYLDDWMKMARERGVRSIVWFLGGNPNGYPETLAIEAELYALMNPGGKEAYYEKMRLPDNRGKILPEIQGVYRQWLSEVSAHARANGWPELIFTPFDEPAKWAYKEPRAEPNRKYAIGCGPWIRDHFKAACALIHETVPQNKVYMSLHNNFVTEAHGYKGRVGEIFIPDVDIVCTNAVDDDSGLGDKVRRAGKEFWQYTGLQSPRYSFGFWFGAWDSRGSLCWAYNWGARFDITAGSNWQYAWHGPFGTVLTPAYEEMREAWDDRRYLETAKAAAKRTGRDIVPVLEAIRQEVMQSHDSDNGWRAGGDPARMDAWRRRLADFCTQ